MAFCQLFASSSLLVFLRAFDVSPLEMQATKLRRQIAWEAARLMYWREESEYQRAKIKAARKVQIGWVKPSNLPSNAEIRDQVLALARMLEGAQPHQSRLQQMRLRAMWWLQHLSPFHPKLIGSVLTGHIRDGSDIDLHAFSGSIQAVVNRVEEVGTRVEVERKRVIKDGVARTFTHIHVSDIFPIEITVYDLPWLRFRFKSSITGKPIECATTDQLSRLIALDHGTDPNAQRDQLNSIEHPADRWRVYESLLLPLERVEQSRKYHPEGDALYHSLQVYMFALEEMPYDEEFLLAALLHDVGKAIDPVDHVAAGLEALDGFVSERTSWLIAQHMEGHAVVDRTIGSRRRKRLRESPWFDDLVTLAECDAAGRIPGMQVDDLDQALDYIRQIETMFG